MDQYRLSAEPPQLRFRDKKQQSGDNQTPRRCKPVRLHLSKAI